MISRNWDKVHECDDDRQYGECAHPFKHECAAHPAGGLRPSQEHTLGEDAGKDPPWRSFKQSGSQRKVESL